METFLTLTEAIQALKDGLAITHNTWIPGNYNTLENGTVWLHDKDGYRIDGGTLEEWMETLEPSEYYEDEWFIINLK